MSPQESRILWCLVKGDPMPYYVQDIPIGANVTQLKELISIKCLEGQKHHHLKLWKLDVVVPIDPDHSLAQRLAALGNIDECSTKLSSAEEVGELFPEPLREDNLHIVVQREILAPSGPSASRKRLRSGTEEDGQAAKRKEIDGDVQTRCVAIHEAIKAMPDNLDLSDPLTFTTLPFPSLLPIPPQRFARKKTKEVDQFEYMGRSKFRELQERIENENFLDGAESLCLYGTSGSGKSHLLAALVYRLVREGERVFYIPDCSSLLLEPAGTMRAAYNFAFYDSPVLGNPHNVEALIDLVANDRDVYVIVDQVNTLEFVGDDGCKDKKVQATNWLDALRFNHRYIFSASANEISNREVYRKQNAISVFRIFGGMSEDETNRWFTHHSHQIPPLSVEQRQLVEYLTGRIPLLLRCLLNIPEFVEPEFRNMTDLRNIALEVRTFGSNKLDSLLPLSKDTYLKIMRACVRGDTVMVNDRTLYDLRHFYVDDDQTGCYTCGIAFETMMSILRTHDNASFLDQSWYTAVSQSANPIVRGFLAEQICLSHIAVNGLEAVHPDLGRMSTRIFDTNPAFDELLSTENHTIRLFLPSAYNFQTVGGVILLVDRKAKKATMFPIQFTLSQNHKQSDKEFHTRLWSTWIKPITSAGFSVHSTFVWIDKKQPSEQVEPQVVKTLRSGDKVVHPEYSVVHVSVEMVNSRLPSALDIEQ